MYTGNTDNRLKEFCCKEEWRSEAVAGPVWGLFAGVLRMGRIIDSLPRVYPLVVGVRLSLFACISGHRSQPSSEKLEGEGREVVSRCE